MKSILVFSLLICGFFASADDGNRELKITEHAQTWVDKYDVQWAHIPGLRPDLFQTLRVAGSKGPAWKQKMIDLLSETYDFHESASYYGERYTHEDCEMTEEEWEEVIPEFEFKYHAIKPINGSQKTIMYIVEAILVLKSETAECRRSEDDYVFLNARDEAGKPVYLGIFSASPMP